jgi:hypothetical protein
MTNPAVFDFTELATRIYSEKKGLHKSDFLLPALYGGEPSKEAAYGRFKALVVLEEPSLPETEAGWVGACESVKGAIGRHREIFFRWASKGLQAELFDAIVGKLSEGDFFRRLYITDVWKGGGFSPRRRVPNDAEYWRSILEYEIKSVATDRVIFVDGEALRNGFTCVPVCTLRHWIDFPTPTTNFRAQLPRLRLELQIGQSSSTEEIAALLNSDDPDLKHWAQELLPARSVCVNPRMKPADRPQ